MRATCVFSTSSMPHAIAASRAPCRVAGARLLRRRTIARAQKRSRKERKKKEPEVEFQPVVEGSKEQDFWEGEQWERFGKVATYGVAIFAALAVVVGFVAAGTYNSGATYVKYRTDGKPAETEMQQPQN